MQLVERVKNILMNPDEEWKAIEAEQTDTAALYRSYVVPLAAIGPICSFIGLAFVGMRLPGIGTFHIPVGNALVHAVLSYLLALAAVFVVALIINGFAPYFAGQQDRMQALKTAAYASTPGWLAGVFDLFPWLGLLAIIVSLYGLYLLYKALPVLMKAPREKALGYTATTVAGAIVVFLVIGGITQSFLPKPTPEIAPSSLPAELLE